MERPLRRLLAFATGAYATRPRAGPLQTSCAGSARAGRRRGPASLEPGENALTLVNRVTYLLQFSGLNVLTDEGIDDPVRDLAEARGRHGVPDSCFRALETGETLRLPA